MTLPASYTVGSGGWMGLPTWRAADATTTWGDVEWAYISPNSYSTGVSALRIDMREFPAGTTPNQVKSIQLFDVYTGPVEYMSEDATWALYKVPSTFAKAADGTSTYAAYIRQNTTDYSFRAEFEFNTSVNNSWGAITISNWNNITYPRALFKTGILGTNAILDLKYLLWGDVNRSHSSQVVTTSGGSSTVQTNAIPSLLTNSTFTTETSIKSMASTGPYINTDFAYTSIDVNLANQTVTANTTATKNDRLFLIDTTAGGIVITLPDPTGLSGKQFVVKKLTSAHTITVDTTGTAKIDGGDTHTINQHWASHIFETDGVDYFITAEK
jgi:hypothetical protein